MASVDIYVSELVLREVRGGDPQVAAERLAVLETIELVEVVPKALSLANHLVTETAIPQNGYRRRSPCSYRRYQWHRRPINLEL